MKYLKALSIIIMIAFIINCNGKNPKKELYLDSKTTFSIDEKRFLHQKIDSTINYHFAPEDTSKNDLNSIEREKFILTPDAAHIYKLLSLQKKTDNYTGIIVLYVLFGSNMQYYITLDKTGKAIADLLVQSNHGDGPMQLEDGNVLQYKGVSSYFNGDTITVIEKRRMSDSFHYNEARKWEETIEKKYLISNDGRFNLLTK
jgi:hypothetical protein